MKNKINWIARLVPFVIAEISRLKIRMNVLLLFGVVGVISIGLLEQFLFGNKLLLFADLGSDTYYSYYAFYYFLVSNISNFQLPLWSFKLGTGSSVLTLYQFLYDPFAVIYYFGGVENISRLIVWVFVLKTFCACAFTYLYLRCLGVGIYARMVAALLFAFNGFLMVWGQHFFFATWVIFLPLLLYTIEIWFRSNKWLPMTLCVSFMALNIAIFFQVSIFCGLYMLFRLGLEWNNFSKRVWVVKIINFCGIYALGVGVSAVFWLPEYYLLKMSPRISGDFFNSFIEVMRNFSRLNTPEYYNSLLSRVFSNNLQGVGSEYTGFMNYYESIQLYVGILPLLILPQLYIVFSSRAKWVATLALCAVAAFLIFIGFSQVMNGFQYPAYRWGYNINMFELLLTALVLDLMLKRQKINFLVLILTGFVLVLCIVFIGLNSHSSDFSSYKYFFINLSKITAFIVCYSVILYLLVVMKSKRLIFSLLLVIICGELILEHRDTFVRRNVFYKGIEQSRDVNFFDYGKQAVEKLNEKDQSFYRIEKNHWILSLNDSLIQNYSGLDSYNSLVNPSYLNFLKAFGYPSVATTVKWSSLDHPYLADVLSVKYHLTKNTDKLPQHVMFIAKYGDVSIYERRGFLPFGFTYDSYVPLSVFSQLSKADRERAFLQGAVLDENPPIKLQELIKIDPSLEEDYFKTRLQEDVLNVEEMGDDKIIGSINLKRSKLLFLSIPFDFGWSVYVNGKESELHKINVGFTGLYLDQGRNIIELRYAPPYMKLGAGISILCLFIAALLLIRAKNVVDDQI